MYDKRVLEYISMAQISLLTNSKVHLSSMQHSISVWSEGPTGPRWTDLAPCFGSLDGSMSSQHIFKHVLLASEVTYSGHCHYGPSLFDYSSDLTVTQTGLPERVKWAALPAKFHSWPAVTLQYQPDGTWESWRTFPKLNGMRSSLRTCKKQRTRPKCKSCEDRTKLWRYP